MTYTIQRCEECGEVISGEEDFKAGRDDPNLCELCNEERR